MTSAISNSLNVPKIESRKRKSSQKSNEYVTTFELVRTITAPNPSKPIRVHYTEFNFLNIISVKSEHILSSTILIQVELLLLL